MRLVRHDTPGITVGVFCDVGVLEPVSCQYLKGPQIFVIEHLSDGGRNILYAEVANLASMKSTSRSKTGQRSGRTMRSEGESKVYLLLMKGSGEEDWGRESTQYLAENGIDVTKREWTS